MDIPRVARVARAAREAREARVARAARAQIVVERRSGITNTPHQQAFLLEPEGEEIFLQINQLMDTLEQVPIAQTDKYYRNAAAELVHFIKFGQMAINIRRKPDTPESKYNQTILFQYQSLLLRTPRRLPYDGLGNSMEIPLHDILS